VKPTALSRHSQIVQRPLDLPGLGRFAIIADPQGAYIGCVACEERPEAKVPGRAYPGRFCWNELTTSDPEAAECFYGGMFGWSR